MIGVEMTRQKGVIHTGSMTRGELDISDLKKAFEINAKILLAGPVIEELVFPGNIERHDRQHRDDQRQGVRMAVYLACHEAGIEFSWEDDPEKVFESLTVPVKENVQRILNRLMIDTAALVKEHSPAIVRVAAALLHTDRMEQDELDRLIAGRVTDSTRLDMERVVADEH